VTKTWIVQSMVSPEMPEKICCESITDAACGWAKRMFRKGLLVRTGTSVLVRCVDDPVVVKRPAMSATTYQVKIAIVDMPAFQARLEGVVYDGVNGGPGNGSSRG